MGDIGDSASRARTLLARLCEAIAHEEPRAVALRHRLHAHPELAHAEEWTAATVAAELPVTCTPAAGTGRLARIDPAAPPPAGPPGTAPPAATPAGPPVAKPTGTAPLATIPVGPPAAGPPAAPPVAIRAELDGLPVAERTGAPYAAPGGTMHACGHDVHMAALVALAHAAEALANALPAPLLLIFQPSEEAYPSGAELLRGDVAAHQPAAIVAAHVHPEVPWGTVALDPGAVNASCDAVQIVVEGAPAHGAYPHRGRDPILALAHTIVALHAQAGRRTDPLHPATITIGAIEGGAAENVIPAQASARGAIRAHRPEERETLRKMVQEVAVGTAAAHGCRANVTLTPGEPPLANDPALVARARALLEPTGLRAAPEWRSCGSDDLALLSDVAPLAMAFVGLEGAPGFTPRPLHHPELLPPDAAVGAVACTLALLYVAAAVPV